MQPGNLVMDPKRMLEAVDEYHRGGPTFGVTCTPDIMNLLNRCKDQLVRCTPPRASNVDIHVDAASGGFLAPFCAPHIRVRFPLATSKVDQFVRTSDHGLAPVGVGWVVGVMSQTCRKTLLRGRLSGRLTPTIAINFSRPAGQVICQYYDFLRLGKEGYRNIQSACYGTAQIWPKPLLPWAHSNFCTMAIRKLAFQRSAGGSRTEPTPIQLVELVRPPSSARLASPCICIERRLQRLDSHAHYGSPGCKQGHGDACCRRHQTRDKLFPSPPRDRQHDCARSGPLQAHLEPQSAGRWRHYLLTNEMTPAGSGARKEDLWRELQ